LREKLDPTLSEIDVAIVTDCGEIEKNFEIQGRDSGKMQCSSA
jgi:hypothetical protein